ncbi:MAG: hypothetical protein HYV63_23000 [Candidatus Schekmanbacteria bacterium]|nr:hypothetical protein [Candidatus Schekmanbacteria bacterium]
MAPCPERVGPYRVLDLLGRGGMGLVYRAEHTESGDLVALKLVQGKSHAAIRGARREIFALQRLRHPGIVPLREQGLHDGLPWYSMALLRGKRLTLALRIDDLGGTTVSGAADEVGQASESESEPTSGW